MDKLKMQSMDKVSQNIDKIAIIFPNCVTEIIDENGKPTKAVDFDMLRQELSSFVVEGMEERYQFAWADKLKGVLFANSPIAKTLRPYKEESVNFDTTKNLYIEGDNLDVLKLLQETYMGKIKMVYMDPPYNTGNDIIYKNDYSIDSEQYSLNGKDEEGNYLFCNTETNGRFHTDWVNMMYQRIKLAKELLKDDGCMVLSIDHYELSNLINICNEIFGERNKIGIVSIIHKPEGRNQGKYFATSNEFALFYAKDILNFEFEPVIIDKEKNDEFKYNDDKGRYKLESLITKNRGRQGYDKNLKINNPKNHYPIYVSPDLKKLSLKEVAGYSAVLPNTKTQERTWRFIKESLQSKINSGEVVAVRENEEIKIMEKQRIEKGQLIKTHWIDTRYNYAVHGTRVLSDLMGSGVFDFPKSIHLMSDIIKLTTKKDSIVLDLFSGSATTAHAIMCVNAEDSGERSFINVQLNSDLNELLKKSTGEAKNSIDNTIKFLSEINKPHFLSEVGKERIRRAGNKLKEENQNKKHIGELDIGFRVLKVDSSNMKPVYYNPDEIQQDLLMEYTDNIKKGRTADDLLFQVMLDMGVELSNSIIVEMLGGKSVYTVGDNNLICCFDPGMTKEAITEIAKRKPKYAIFRDSGFERDDTLVSFDQIFETYSPTTERRVI